MIEFTEARELILSAAKALPAESVPLPLALGRTLARDIKAAEDIPPFTKAAMDGFAVRAAATAGWVDPFFPEAAAGVEWIEWAVPAGPVAEPPSH